MQVENAVSPLRRAEQLDSTRGCRRGLCACRHVKRSSVCGSRSSSAAALSSQAAQGYLVNTRRDIKAAFFWFLFLAAQEKELAAGVAPAACQIYGIHDSHVVTTVTIH